MNNFKTYFKSLLLLFTTPQGSAISLATMIAAYFSPLYAISLVIFIFILIDFITGILAAKKRKEKVTSNKMRNTITKLLCYYVTIILAFLIQKEIIVFEWFLAVNLSAGIIVLAEFKSILENMSYLSNNNVFKSIFTVINSLFKKKIEIEIPEDKTVYTNISENELPGTKSDSTR